jgi:ABC-type polysaccharide/polyol phosphate export permease
MTQNATTAVDVLDRCGGTDNVDGFGATPIDASGRAEAADGSIAIPTGAEAHGRGQSPRIPRTRATAPARQGAALPLRHAVDVISILIRRDFILNYRRSVLGILWSLLVPLAQLLVLVLVFQIIVPLHIDAYPAFVFSALLPWTWFSTCLTSASGLFIANRDLMLRPSFSPAALLIASTLSNLAISLAATPVLIGVLAWYGRPLTSAVLVLPVLISIEGVLIVGLGLIIATLNVFYRDVQYLVTVLLTLLFYLTPVFYRAEGALADYRFLYVLNPVAVLIQAYRSVAFDGTAPAWAPLLLASAVSLVMTLGGLAIYRSQEHDLLDAL